MRIENFLPRIEIDPPVAASMQEPTSPNPKSRPKRPSHLSLWSWVPGRSLYISRSSMAIGWPQPKIPHICHTSPNIHFTHTSTIPLRCHGTLEIFKTIWSITLYKCSGADPDEISSGGNLDEWGHS
jgi:hypothetical protein